LRFARAVATFDADSLLRRTTTTLEQHVRLPGVLHIVDSTLALLAGIVLFLTLLGSGVFVGGLPEVRNGLPVNVRVVLCTLGPTLGGFIALASIPGIIGGIGLTEHKERARNLVLLVGLVDLLPIPRGTLVRIQTICALLNDEAIKLSDVRSANLPSIGSYHPIIFRYSESRALPPSAHATRCRRGTGPELAGVPRWLCCG